MRLWPYAYISFITARIRRQIQIRLLALSAPMICVHVYSNIGKSNNRKKDPASAFGNWERRCLFQDLLFPEPACLSRQSLRGAGLMCDSDTAPAKHTSPPTACKAFSYANSFWRGFVCPYLNAFEWHMWGTWHVYHTDACYRTIHLSVCFGSDKTTWDYWLSWWATEPKCITLWPDHLSIRTTQSSRPSHGSLHCPHTLLEPFLSSFIP